MTKILMVPRSFFGGERGGRERGQTMLALTSILWTKILMLALCTGRSENMEFQLRLLFYVAPSKVQPRKVYPNTLLY